MKIALVNLCKIEDFSKTSYYLDSLEFLKENNIDFIDYISGRESPDDLLEGFHEAVSNEEVQLIWFIQGGNDLIKFLDRIDWNLVERSNKEYLGLSDFTHFVFRAVKLGKTCYYGPCLKKIKSYLPSHKERNFVVDFLTKKQLSSYGAELLRGDGGTDLESKKIVGGHSFISAFMLADTSLDLRARLLFFEHHYLPGEDVSDAVYFLNAVKLQIRHNSPQGIILGRSIVYGKDGEMLDAKEINRYFLEELGSLNLPVYYVDHFQTIVKFS
ncbi:MAG: LD-carboxypeptidase [bacterium]|nr:LD-carboxypeptidase [bacterium]